MEVLFCEIDGPVQGGMQFRVLVEAPLCEIRGHVVPQIAESYRGSNF